MAESRELGCNRCSISYCMVNVVLEMMAAAAGSKVVARSGP